MDSAISAGNSVPERNILLRIRSSEPPRPRRPGLRVRVVLVDLSLAFCLLRILMVGRFAFAIPSADPPPAAVPLTPPSRSWDSPGAASRCHRSPSVPI